MDSSLSLVTYFANQDIELRDDDCLYYQNQRVGTDVSNVYVDENGFDYSYKPTIPIKYITVEMALQIK
jgi:hypothetical protein